jgi:hypothetical protein
MDDAVLLLKSPRFVQTPTPEAKCVKKTSRIVENQNRFVGRGNAARREFRPRILVMHGFTGFRVVERSHYAIEHARIGRSLTFYQRDPKAISLALENRITRVLRINPQHDDVVSLQASGL